MAIPGSPFGRGAVGHILDFQVNFDNSDIKASIPETVSIFKKLYDVMTKGSSAANAVVVKNTKEAAAAFDRLNESTNGMFNSWTKLGSAKGMGSLLKNMGEIRKAGLLSSAGVTQSPSEVRKASQMMTKQYREMVSGVVKEVKGRGGNIWDEIGPLKMLHEMHEQSKKTSQAIINDANNVMSPAFWERLARGLTINPQRYLAISQAIRDAKGLNPVENVRGISYGVEALSQGGVSAGESLGKMVAQRGGKFGAGRDMVHQIMFGNARGGRTGVGSGAAIASAVALTNAGWADKAAGPLGQAVAALSEARGSDPAAIVQLAGQLRLSGMSDDNIVKYLGTLGKRHKFGQAAVSSIGGAITEAMPGLQSAGINVGGAAESMSRLQEVITRGLGMGEEGAGIAGQMVRGLGRQMGNPRAMKELAALGIFPQDVQAAMRGDLAPLLGKLKASSSKYKGLDTYTKQAMASAFGMDVTQLSTLINKAGGFTEQGIEKSAASSTEALDALASAALEATSTLKSITNMGAAGGSWANSKTGGFFGQITDSGIVGQLGLLSLALPQITRMAGGVIGMGQRMWGGLGRNLLGSANAPSWFGGAAAAGTSMMSGLGGPPSPDATWDSNTLGNMLGGYSGPGKQNVPGRAKGGWMNMRNWKSPGAKNLVRGAGFIGGAMALGSAAVNTYNGTGSGWGNTLEGAGGAMLIGGAAATATVAGSVIGVPLMIAGTVASILGSVLNSNADKERVDNVTGVAADPGTDAMVAAVDRLGDRLLGQDNNLNKMLASNGTFRIG
jgi:hypothetical protein